MTVVIQNGADVFVLLVGADITAQVYHKSLFYLCFVVCTNNEVCYDPVNPNVMCDTQFRIYGNKEFMCNVTGLCS